jgi:hypothetical protein
MLGLTGFELVFGVDVCGVHVPMAWLWDANDRVRRWSTNGHASLAASLDCSQTQPC